MKLTPEYVRDTLLRLGFSPRNKGFSYIVEAMMIMEENENAAFNTVKQIYMPIAEKRGVNYPAVERNIRHAVEAAMELGYEKIPDFLHCQPTATSGSYKNSDFLAAFHMALHRG